MYKLVMPRDPVAPPLWPTKIIPLASLEVSLNISVDKARKSLYTFNEFAVFIAQDITAWNGKEAGFRFPFDREKDEFCYYSQHSFGGLWRENDEVLPNLEEFHTYNIKIVRCCWNFWKALLAVDGKKRKYCLWMGDVKPWYLVLTAHNHESHQMYLDKDYVLKVVVNRRK